MKRTPIWCTALLALACSCKAPKVSYPDSPKVVKAQKVWCAALAKHEPAKGTGAWLLRGDCEKAYPAGSAEYVVEMATCYSKRHEEYEDVGDFMSLVKSCTEEVLVGADPGDVSNTEIITSRCGRMLKCEQVPIEECKTAFNSIEGYARAVLTSMYNLSAQHEIAECLLASECTRDEDTARTACYEKSHQARVWLPFSTGRDESVAPRPSTE